MYQQIIWETFDHIQAGWEASGDTDQAFLASVKNASSFLDNGIHIGSWGQLQGWSAYLLSTIFSRYLTSKSDILVRLIFSNRMENRPRCEERHPPSFIGAIWLVPWLYGCKRF
jgi:hypothetical protein